MNRFSMAFGLVIILGLASALRAASEAPNGLFDRLDGDGDAYLQLSEVPAEHARLFERLLRKADKDGDQRLSRAELDAGLAPSTPPKPIQQEQATSRPRFDALKLLLLRLDTSRDSHLTRNEAPRELRDAFDELAKVADQDKDGEIAFRELLRTAGKATRVAGNIARRQRWEVSEELARIERQQGDAAKRFESQPDPRAVLRSPERMASLFKQLDADGDGRLKLDEAPEQLRGRLARLFQRADRDRSGDLTPREMRAAARQVSQLMNLSERLSGPTPKSPDEPPPMMPSENIEMEENDPRGGTGERLVRRMVQRMDKNNDGRIAKSEASGQLARRFDAADSNSDGMLDRIELQQVARRLQERLERADKAARE